MLGAALVTMADSAKAYLRKSARAGALVEPGTRGVSPAASAG
jgi:hypothetical protein